MTSQERFTVFVKALGVWILATGLGTLPIATFQLREFSDPQDLFYMILGSIAEPMLMCLGGFWLIRSNWISRIAYSSVKVPGQAVSDVSDSVATLELFSAILKTLGVWFLFQGITRIPFGLNWLHSQNPHCLFSLSCPITRYSGNSGRLRWLATYRNKLVY